MSARTYVQTTASILREMELTEQGLQIEPDPARGLMFLRVGSTTFAAPMQEVAR